MHAAQNNNSLGVTYEETYKQAYRSTLGSVAKLFSSSASVGM